jgi:hypothetical protein
MYAPNAMCTHPNPSANHANPKFAGVTAAPAAVNKKHIPIQRTGDTE